MVFGGSNKSKKIKLIKNKKRIPILIIGFKYNHHSRFSGYDCVVNYLSGDHDITYLNLYKFIFFKFKSNIIQNFAHRLNHRALLLILKYYLNFSKSNYEIVHFLYPEDVISKFKYKKRENQIVIASFHQSNEWFRDLTFSRKSNLSVIDIAIALGHSQVDLIKTYLGIKKIYQIPHGIDCEFFKPANFERTPNRILVVGSWMRDLELMEKLISRFNARHKSIKFDLLLGLNSKTRFLKYSNVNVFDYISDEKLLHLYQNTFLVLFILKDAVANNALLESMATGNAIIVNDVGSVLSYATSDSVSLVSNDLDSYESSILELLSNSHKSNSLRCKSLDTSKRFCWKIIAQEISSLYENVSSY